MKVLIVSGIWPPDVGGPATHAPDLAAFLHGHGHEVAVLTTASASPEPTPYPVRWISRQLPAPLRYGWGAVLAARAARHADVVYSTGMIGRTRVGALIGHAPRVIKLTGDPAYERAVRYGLTRLPLDEFQRSHGVKIAGLKALRNVLMSGARAYVCPSESLRAIAAKWRLVDAERIVVLPNPVSVPSPGDREALRRRHGFEGPTLVFAGRLAPQKSLDVALRALTTADGVTLIVVGDGPEGPAVEALAESLGLGRRVRLLGGKPRELVFELLAAADAMLLSSSWENFPHAVVEALAVGTPVISTDVGGVGEVITDGVNGLLVAIGSSEDLGAAIRRFFDDAELRERLRSATIRSVESFSPDRIYIRIEELLKEAAK